VREPAKAVQNAQDSRAIFDRLPIGILVYRLNNLIYANRVFLEWTGYATLDALNEAGGLDSLFIDSKDKSTSKDGGNGAKTLTIATINGTQKPVEGRLFSAMWNGENALVLMIDPRVGTNEKPIGISPDSVTRENRELKAILDTATDGVLMLDRTGRIIFANRSAEALFGYESADFTEHSFGDLLAPESRRLALEHLDRLAHSSGAGVLDAGYDAIGRVRQGGLVPLHITMGRIEGGEKLCVVLREVTAWKHTAEELTDARQAAEKASIAKSEFVAKISHEIRTPLNAIIGFSEVMMDERFGPIGNERYRQYLKDIHASGGHLISLLNDLVDLSKIETGKLDLTFVSVSLNDLTQQCVAIMQQQASREHVIVRTSLSANLPQIVADARSVRQIALNLLSNSIKFTGAGGQVIVSTALTDDQEVVLRVRDTGTGMSEKDLETALEPFRQVATVAHWGSSGTGLGLPIIKALVEANHARFRIASEVGSGTLVEVAFPTTRVLAQ
jgi:PAS domain S-box-containing protein